MFEIDEMKLEIMTSLCVEDCNLEFNEMESDLIKNRLVMEQCKKLRELVKGNVFAITFYESVFNDEFRFEDVTSTEEILDCIDYLAIKDGADFIRFPNGRYGFVAYYNGWRSGFDIEIIE